MSESTADCTSEHNADCASINSFSVLPPKLTALDEALTNSCVYPPPDTTASAIADTNVCGVVLVDGAFSRV